MLEHSKQGDVITLVIKRRGCLPWIVQTTAPLEFMPLYDPFTKRTIEPPFPHFLESLKLTSFSDKVWSRVDCWIAHLGHPAPRKWESGVCWKIPWVGHLIFICMNYSRITFCCHTKSHVKITKTKSDDNLDLLTLSVNLRIIFPSVFVLIFIFDWIIISTFL